MSDVEMSELEKSIKVLDDLISVQSDSGNWDYNEYMYGLLNGMLLAKAVLTDNNPPYPDRPGTWMQDTELHDKFNKSGSVING